MKDAIEKTQKTTLIMALTYLSSIVALEFYIFASTYSEPLRSIFHNFFYVFLVLYTLSWLACIHLKFLEARS